MLDEEEAPMPDFLHCDEEEAPVPDFCMEHDLELAEAYTIKTEETRSGIKANIEANCTKMSLTVNSQSFF